MFQDNVAHQWHWYRVYVSAQQNQCIVYIMLISRLVYTSWYSNSTADKNREVAIGVCVISIYLYVLVHFIWIHSGSHLGIWISLNVPLCCASYKDVLSSWSCTEYGNRICYHWWGDCKWRIYKCMTGCCHYLVVHVHSLLYSTLSSIQNKNLLSFTWKDCLLFVQL